MHNKIVLMIAAWAFATCLQANGATCSAGVVSGTLDCAGTTVNATSSCFEENPGPVFQLKDGAILKNVTINRSGGGITCEGNCTLVNVIWANTDSNCVTAAKLLAGGKSMTIEGGSASNLSAAVFLNSAIGGTINIKNFTASHIGTLYRSCGACLNNNGPRHVTMTNVTLDSVMGDVARVNSNFNDTAVIRNLRIKAYKPGKPAVCVRYLGVQRELISTRLGETWKTKVCDVSRTDVTAF